MCPEHLFGSTNKGNTMLTDGRVGSGRRTARRRGEAGPGRTGRRRVGSPRRQPFLLPFSASNTPVVNVSSDARTSGFLGKPMGEQNVRFDDRLISGFVGGTAGALRSWLLTSGPTPICFCKPFSCRECPGKTVHVVFYSAHIFLFSSMPCVKKVPGHALLEKGLQRQKGGSLVSS